MDHSQGKKMNITSNEIIKFLTGNNFSYSPSEVRRQSELSTHLKTLPGSRVISEYNSIIPKHAFGRPINSHETYIVVIDAEINNYKINLTNQSRALPNLIFINSNVDTLIEIDNSTIGDIWLLGGSYCEGIHLSNKSKCNNIYIYNKSNCRQIRLDSQCICNRINASNAFIGRVDILNESICSSLQINDNSTCANITINENSSCDLIQILNSEPFSEIEIKNSECEVLTTNTTGQRIHVRDSKIKSIGINKYIGELRIHNTDFVVAKFDGCVFYSLSIAYSVTGEIYFNSCRVYHLNLANTTIPSNMVCGFRSTLFFVVELSNCIVLGHLILRNIRHIMLLYWLEDRFTELSNVDTLDEAQTSEKKKLTLERDRFLYESILIRTQYGDSPRFILADSSMGKTEITGSDLTGFKLEYRDTNMLDMFINSTKLPKGAIEVYIEGNQSMVVHDDESKADTYSIEQQISIYSQLKKIMDSMGNIVESTWYHSKTMEFQEELLNIKMKEKYKYAIWGVFSKEQFDKITFFLNQLSNNHGENIRRAFGFIVISSIFFYSWYFFSFEKNQSCRPELWGDYWKFIFLYINPAHYVNFMVEKDELTISGVIADFLGRIFIGYGIYQFIAAFRRHNRR